MTHQSVAHNDDGESGYFFQGVGYHFTHRPVEPYRSIFATSTVRPRYVKNSHFYRASNYAERAIAIGGLSVLLCVRLSVTLVTDA